MSIIYLCLCATKGQAQAVDKIVRKDSAEWYVIIVNMEDDSITYRYYGQPKDSVYAIAKSAVQKVILRNGGGDYYPKPIVYNADGTIKLPKISPVYVDAAAGLSVLLQTAIADISIGYRFNEKQAIGLSRILMSDYTTNAEGIGVQYRWTPQRRALYKLELGYITSAGSIDRSGPEIYTHLPQNSSNVYIRIGAAVRFGGVFTWGINYAGSGPLTFQVSNSMNGQNVQSGKTWAWSMGFLCAQLGVAFPQMPKKKSVDFFYTPQ